MIGCPATQPAVSGLPTVTGGVPDVVVVSRTLTVVSPALSAPPKTVDILPESVDSLPICSDVPPRGWMTGVALIESDVVYGYGFSTLLSSWMPPTLKPGMPAAQKAADGSSVDRICASGAVP